MGHRVLVKRGRYIRISWVVVVVVVVYFLFSLL
jgi:hypothetical protein